MVAGQQDGLLQCHTQGAAVGQRGQNIRSSSKMRALSEYVSDLADLNNDVLIQFHWVQKHYLSSYFLHSEQSEHTGGARHNKIICSDHKTSCLTRQQNMNSWQLK